MIALAGEKRGDLLARGEEVPELRTEKRHPDNWSAFIRPVLILAPNASWKKRVAVEGAWGSDGRCGLIEAHHAADRQGRVD